MPARRRPLPPALTATAFSRSQAREHDISRGVLRGPGVRRIGHDLYLDSIVDPTHADLARAHLRTLPVGISAIDGITALQLVGIEVGPSRPFHFVTTAGHHSKRALVQVRRACQLPPCVDGVVRPLPALLAARTQLDLRELVVAGDWVVRARLASIPEVRATLTAATGRHCARARRAGHLVRAGSESPQETRLRLLVVLAGLPEPECNVELGDDYFFIARVDLYLRAWNMALEYEGDQHRTDARVWARDLKRYEALAASEVLPIRVAKEHLRRPREVVQRIHTALLSRGYEGPAPVFTAEWRAAFEGGRG